MTQWLRYVRKASRKYIWKGKSFCYRCVQWSKRNWHRPLRTSGQHCLGKPRCTRRGRTGRTLSCTHSHRFAILRPCGENEPNGNSKKGVESRSKDQQPCVWQQENSEPTCSKGRGSSWRTPRLFVPAEGWTLANSSQGCLFRLLRQSIPRLSYTFQIQILEKEIWGEDMNEYSSET